MRKTFDAIYSHPYFEPLYRNRCRIRIYEAFNASENRPTVILATQIPDSRGTSVTNAAEELATEVVRLQRARRRLSVHDPRNRIVWVEHYPVNALKTFYSEDLFQIVSFLECPDGTLSHPQWERVNVRSFLARLPTLPTSIRCTSRPGAASNRGAI